MLTQPRKLSARQDNSSSNCERIGSKRLAPIQQQIKSETYNVKGELVAKSILKSNLLDEII